VSAALFEGALAWYLGAFSRRCAVAVVAEAEIEVDTPVAKAFARFRDFGAWRQWMPRAFAPVKGPSAPIAAGDRITVRLGGALPSQLTVLRVRDNKEVCWRGGVPGLIVGEHSFYFDDLGEGRTRIRSSEPFRGLLLRVGPLAQRIEHEASAVGAEMLRAFAAHLA